MGQNSGRVWLDSSPCGIVVVSSLCSAGRSKMASFATTRLWIQDLSISSLEQSSWKSYMAVQGSKKVTQETAMINSQSFKGQASTIFYWSV